MASRLRDSLGIHAHLCDNAPSPGLAPGLRSNSSVAEQFDLLTAPGQHPGRQPSEAAMYKTILVPLDGSKLAEQALPLALAIARGARAKLRLVRVHRPAAH